MQLFPCVSFLIEVGQLPPHPTLLPQCVPLLDCKLLRGQSLMSVVHIHYKVLQNLAALSVNKFHFKPKTYKMDVRTPREALGSALQSLKSRNMNVVCILYTIVGALIIWNEIMTYSDVILSVWSCFLHSDWYDSHLIFYPWVCFTRFFPHIHAFTPGATEGFVYLLVF